MKKKQQQQHPGSGADPWPHGAPLGGAPPGLGSWKRRVSLLPLLRFSLRDYGFCMATLLVFCLGSLFYQLGGGPPRFLLDLRQYLGNSTYLDDHGPPPSKTLPFPSQVVYNRVGKCGSRTVVLLLRILSEKHGFNLVTSDIHNKTRLTKNEQMELIKNISTAEQPYLFTRHVHFLNFSRFGGDQPVYINIIRDPVNRFLSNYFFRRFGDWRGEQNHMIRTPSMSQEERYLDINECILANYPECSNPRLFYIIPYFCGQHPRCREPGEWALERAKLNVNENFLLVGILEELEDVLLLLERFLPHYFKGVLSIYKDPVPWEEQGVGEPSLLAFHWPAFCADRRRRFQGHRRTSPLQSFPGDTSLLKILPVAWPEVLSPGSVQDWPKSHSLNYIHSKALRTWVKCV
ncbi:uronyl 2-sulfotransferase isoform X2 [Physeter macrocephalus]|uniref:Uronyl 2-sulfotransferase n=1 Tax=Physeter macrocephalus TaxID=9755 RepID=A0A455BN26_PHYMC|nr:uronyl 2-sulfotransferase isoform X2 [Physeter catodon]|eukprot:XP_028350137.1 uronyl 2-sulfotransferase isoform X3 [Physeter catodon]